MLRGILYKLGLPKFPKSTGTVKEFRDWELQLKKEYPVRYAIGEAINLCGRPARTAKWNLRNAYWWVQYRVNPKHKYTTIKLKRLDPGYYDEDSLLFYAMFEIFENFMKRQLTNPQVIWEYDEDCFPKWQVEEDLEGIQKEIASHNADWKEMNEIYNWWVNVYPKREETLPEYPELPKEWGTLSVINEDFDGKKQMKKWKGVNAAHFKAEEDWRKEDQEMMIRLVKIHSLLWD